MKNKTQKTSLVLATLAGAGLLAGSTQAVKADVIFAETFSINASGWAANSAGTPATWATTGGVTGDGDGYITAAAVTTSSGAVVLRAQTNLGSSPGLFGNWTSTGASPLSVYTLSFDLYQDSGATHDFGLRFTTAAGFPGAFTTSTISLPTGLWTHFEVPINNTAFTFPEGGGSYDSIFSSLARVQFTVSGTPASSFNVRLDNVTISTAPAPEPSTFALVGMGLTLLGIIARQVKRNA
ncbi:MAG: PEP-CTERM sorting domain-containing protein [Limisphaerales bacterium]